MAKMPSVIFLKYSIISPLLPEYLAIKVWDKNGYETNSNGKPWLAVLSLMPSWKRFVKSTVTASKLTHDDSATNINGVCKIVTATKSVRKLNKTETRMLDKTPFPTAPVARPVARRESTQMMELIENSVKDRPATLILDDVKWKYLVRSVLRGKNLMITGPAGSGKTLSVTTVARAMNRPFFYVNLGATQDPRSTLIGNTHFSQKSGTYFASSAFVNAIQTPNTVILLDELSRAHPEAWNILMTVLDDTQRYLRVDESPDTPVITVAEGVTFLATANIGIEYTSTRVIDRALADRFSILEMDVLTKSQQFDLIKLTYPALPDIDADVLSAVYAAIQIDATSGAGKVSNAISTRTILSCAGLMEDGFSFANAAEVSIYPYFSNDGGTDSERTYVRQVVQRFMPADALDNDNIFDELDTAATALPPNITGYP